MPASPSGSTRELDCLAYRPTEAAKIIGTSRSGIYEEIAAGRLPARKLGSRTLILRADLERYLSELPMIGDPDEAA